MFPNHRPRRLRSNDTLRRMVRETVLTPNDLIYPLFAVPGEGFAKEVVSMPGVFQLSVDKIVDEAKEAYDLGIPAIIHNLIHRKLIDTRHRDDFLRKALSRYRKQGVNQVIGS